MRNGRRRQPVGRRGTREASTRHFATPVIVVDEPRDIAQQATLADDPLAQARPARIAVCDAWDDVDTQPDALLFDTLDTDEVPTLTMRRPRPRAEPLYDRHHRPQRTEGTHAELGFRSGLVATVVLIARS